MSDLQAAGESRADPDYLIVGQVVAPFGTRGELKVNIVTEFPDRLKRLKTVTLMPFQSIAPGLAPSAALDPKTVRHLQAIAPSATPRHGPKTPTLYNVEASKIHKDQLILKLEEVGSVEEAEGLRGYWLVVPRIEAAPLPSGAYYLYQLVGLSVYDTEGTLIGKVDDIITMAANDVYVVKGPGVTDPTGELLVPAIKMIVKEIDAGGGGMEIGPVEEWM